MGNRQRFGLFVATMFWLVSVACGIGGPNDTSDVKPKPPGSLGAVEVLYKSLPETSEAVCAYEVKLISQLTTEDQSGWYTEKEYREARVGTKFLSSGNLYSKPGWSWQYKPEGVFNQEGYFCEKDGEQ